MPHDLVQLRCEHLFDDTIVICSEAGEERQHVLRRLADVDSEQPLGEIVSDARP